jgi:uncharacterized protein (TIGR02271 family)
MTFESSTGMEVNSAGRQRTITAFFERREDAEEAMQALRDEGFAERDIRLVPGAERDPSGAQTPRNEPRGFWESLSDLFLPDEDRYSYAEGLSRGGYLITVNATDDSYDTALDLLDREGTIDMDAREQEWRSSGWAGYDRGTAAAAPTSALATGSLAGSTGVGAGFPDETNRGSATLASGSREGLEANTSTGATLGEAGRREAGEVIPLAEEKLRVGKREVGHGRVRVRSYVVETPVEEDVQLREERVSLERRPVDRPISSTDDVFRDRSVEFDERAEEAVIGKDVRIKEELVIGKEEAVRTQKVADTVRHTEVEVSDERGNVTRDVDESLGTQRDAGRTTRGKP